MNYYLLETANQDVVRERLERAWRDQRAREVAPPRAGRLRVALVALEHALAQRERRVVAALR